MSLWTSLEPASATVDPGSTTRVRLRLRNTGDVVDEYRFEPVGPVAPWTTVEPPSLRLYPGTTGTVELTFAPPRTPDATAGPNPYAVRITPTEHPEATTVPEGNLTITPFTEVRAELVPPTVKGRFRGRPKLAVDNLGNTRLTATVNGADNSDQLAYDISPSNVQIEPGRAAFVDATLKPRRIIWFGTKERHPYKLSVLRSGSQPLAAEGTYLQPGFLPRWLATFFGLLTALAVAFAMFWFTHKPGVTTAATEVNAAEAGATLQPTPSPPPSHNTAPDPVQTQPEQKPSTGGGPGGGGAPSTPKHKKPAPVVPASNVLLYNPTTKKCVDIPGYDKGTINGPVREYVCDGSDHDNQLFDLDVQDEHGGPGGAALFLIRNVKDGLCLDLPYNGPAPVGQKITEYTCDATQDNQLYWADKQKNGEYWIRNFTSNQLCIGVDGDSNGGDDTDLVLDNCTNYEDQQWKIVHPEQG
ncbi:RICIN domain-containing protein [Streptomyces sp. NPDC047028]|uniref:ricin-type beta-trefoil lectin domain protein n=1 Tax=Streptomyces sp. NPDC047028 TaxID=3155793 RepID=UPI0033C1E87F